MLRNSAICLHLAALAASWRRDTAHPILTGGLLSDGKRGAPKGAKHSRTLFSLPQSVFLLKGFRKERIWQVEGLLKISADGSQAKGIEREREKVSDEEVTAPLLN